MLVRAAARWPRTAGRCCALRVQARACSTLGPVDTVWTGPTVGSIAEQYCNGCGTRFRGLFTSESRSTKHVFPGRALGRLCARCRALDAENLSACSDETRDVEPDAFVDDMAQIMGRGPALCVQIVDAADFEATCIAATLREVLDGSPVLLAVNKHDLMPRLDEWDVQYMRYRLAKRGLRCVGAHAVSATSGDGVLKLAEAVVAHSDERNVIVCGAASVGKSTLINQLAHHVLTLSDARAEEMETKAKRTPFEEKLAREAAEARDIARAAETSARLAAKEAGGSLEGSDIASLEAALAAESEQAPSSRRAAFSFTLREEREEAVGRLRLTESHMPGTTLGSVAIPCLGSWRHSMYDTPGVILRHSIAYSIFPVHLMAPLMVPATVTPRPPLRVQAGESLVLEAGWMEDETEATGAGPADPPMALARVDVTSVEAAEGGDGGGVYVRHLGSPVVRARVVPTAEAPTASAVPPSYLARLRADFTAQGNTRDANALGDEPMSVPLPPPQPEWTDLQPHLNSATGSRGIDVSFANVGWLALYEPSGRSFELSARPIEGSLAWTRPPMYEFAPTGEGQAAILDGPPSERSYDLDEIQTVLAEASADVSDSPDARAAAAAAELGSMRADAAAPAPQSHVLSQAVSGVFGDRERERLKEEIFGRERSGRGRTPSPPPVDDDDEWDFRRDR